MIIIIPIVIGFINNALQITKIVYLKEEIGSNMGINCTVAKFETSVKLFLERRGARCCISSYRLPTPESGPTCARRRSRCQFRLSRLRQRR